MSKIYLSVVIPCYNEVKNLERGVLSQIYNYLDKQKYTWEVLICDDGSTDRSRQFVEEYIRHKNGFKLLELDHGGKPSAIYGGIKVAKGELLLLADMDQSTPIVELKKLLPWFRENYDIVIGSRGTRREGFNSVRKLASVVFRLVRGIFVLPNITDTQCGFKVIKADLARVIFQRLSYFENGVRGKGWIVSAYDAEMLFIANKWNKRIKEVLVEWSNEDTSTTKNRSMAKFVDESISMFMEVVNIVKHNLKGAYSIDNEE